MMGGMGEHGDAGYQALALQLMANAEHDAWSRFKRAMPEGWARREVEEAERMRRELLDHCLLALSEPDAHAAMAHARWVAKHAEEAAHRWVVVRKAFKQWASLDVGEAVVVLEHGPRR